MSPRFPDEADDPRESFGAMPTLKVMAAAGLALSIIVHSMAILGLRPPPGGLTTMLHFGIFMVWFPTMILLRSMFTPKQLFPPDGWKQDLPLREHWPGWANRALIVLFAYTAINFVACWPQLPKRPAQGARVVQPRPERPSPIAFRAYSGHWMLFYGAALLTLHVACGVEAKTKGKGRPDELDDPVARP